MKRIALLASVVGSLVGCGALEKIQNPSGDAVQVNEAGSALSLSLAPELVRDRDLVVVNLEGPTSVKREFRSPSDGKIRLEKLPVGDYGIVIEFFKGGELIERGEGKAVVVSGKVAVAHVAVHAASGDEGGLTIVVQRDAAAGVVFGANINEIVLSESRATPVCNGFEYSYSRKSSLLTISECSGVPVMPLRCPQGAACAAPAMPDGTGGRIFFSVNVSDEYRKELESILSRLVFKANVGPHPEIACMVGGLVRSARTVSNAGKEKRYSSSTNPCAWESDGIIDAEVFEAVVRDVRAFAERDVPRILATP